MKDEIKDKFQEIYQHFNHLEKILEHEKGLIDNLASRLTTLERKTKDKVKATDNLGKK